MWDRVRWSALTCLASLALSPFAQSVLARESCCQEEPPVGSGTQDVAPPCRSEDHLWLGVSCDCAPEVVLVQLKLESGLAIHSIADDSPAQRAGLQVHDLICAVNGAAIRSCCQLSEIVQSNGLKPLTVRVIRDAKPIEFVVTPEVQPKTNELQVVVLTLNQNDVADSKEIDELSSLLQTSMPCVQLRILVLQPAVVLGADGPDPGKLVRQTDRLLRLSSDDVDKLAVRLDDIKPSKIGHVNLHCVIEKAVESESKHIESIDKQIQALRDQSKGLNLETKAAIDEVVSKLDRDRVQTLDRVEKLQRWLERLGVDDAGPSRAKHPPDRELPEDNDQSLRNLDSNSLLRWVDIPSPGIRVPRV